MKLFNNTKKALTIIGGVVAGLAVVGGAVALVLKFFKKKETEVIYFDEPYDDEDITDEIGEVLEEQDALDGDSNEEAEDEPLFSEE